MQPALTLRYVPEADDLLELLIHAPARRRVRRRALGQAVAVLLILWGSLVALAALEPPWQWWIPVLVLATVLVQHVGRAFAASSRRRLRRRSRALWRRSPRMQLAQEAEIVPEALTIRAEGQTATYSWSQFGSCTESDRQFVLLDRTGRPWIALPKRGLSDTALVPVCRDLLTQYLAGPSPSPPPAPSATAPTDDRPPANG
ncbi:YcxB family protein [Streptomyces sp. NPDC058457]|uniref:YcxB family protein n=1 Tax=Streptomyces sp. NPDC058457 TaxID=3346507 RepID=UPI00364F9522